MIEILNADAESFQVSSDLAAELVEGTLTLDGLNHETRISRITALIELYKAVLTIGELEHTSDWDWGVEVVWGEGELVAGMQPVDDDHDIYSDTISLNYTIMPGDYLDGLARWNYLTIEEYHGDEMKEVLVPIDEIRTITVGRL